MSTATGIAVPSPGSAATGSPLATPRPLPVIVLADVSGSMSVEGKLDVLDASIELLARDLAERTLEEDPFKLAVIAFGGEEARLVAPPTPVGEVSWAPLSAGGGTPLGSALALARNLLEASSGAPTATLVLATDGRPTDAWKPELQALLDCEAGGRALRVAIAIGADADGTALRAFVGEERAHILAAHEAGEIVERFRDVAQIVAPATARGARPLPIDELDRVPAAVGDEALPGRTAGGSAANTEPRAGGVTGSMSKNSSELPYPGSGLPISGSDFAEREARLEALAREADDAEDDFAEPEGDFAEPEAGPDALVRTADDAVELLDEDDHVWRIEREIDRGGQGTVYSLAEGPVVAKILWDHDRITSEQLRARLAEVRRLPLEGLPVAHPLAQLRGAHTGYLMRLVDDVKALDDLSQLPRGADADAWYTQTGGVRRRLRLLARLADTLDRLHGRGLVYGDLSLRNVLVSSSLEHEEVWLIDLDNLRYSDAPGSHAHTRLFAAPEVRLGGTPTALSDAYALAVVICRTLTGRYLPESASREGLELQPQRVLSECLLALARQTFTDGLPQPTRRSRPGVWAHELQRAADLCVVCPRCAANYFAPGAPACRWCGAPRPRLLLVAAGRCDQHDRVALDRRSPHIVAPEHEPLRLTRGHAFGERNSATRQEPVGTFTLEGEQAWFEAAAFGAILVERGHERQLAPGERVGLPAAGPVAHERSLRFQEPGTERRLACLALVPGEQGCD